MNVYYLNRSVSLISCTTRCCVSNNLSLKLVPVALNAQSLNSFHSSCKLDKFKIPPPRPTVYKKPVDWLPFPWHRRPRFNLFLDSGDNIREIPRDPNAPKPDFEFSEELKTADEVVKRAFSIATASKHEAKERMKRDLLKRIQRHPHDFDSLEVKIALRTIQIRALFEHHAMLRTKEKRFSCFVFPIIIQKRNKLLKQLYNIDEARFNWLLKELDLYFKVPKLGAVLEKYNKKWDLRRLTREHCEKMVSDKKAAYHEKLKEQQKAFLEEKKEILAWIEKEEKELKSYLTEKS